MRWSRRRLMAVVGSTAVTGCTDRQPQQSPSEPNDAPPTIPSARTDSYTHLQASGNRLVEGRGAVDSATPVDIAVEGTPAWLLASGETESYWTVVTIEGVATTHRVSDGTSELVADHGRISSPPVGYRSGDTVHLVEAPSDCAEHTHPVVVDGGLCYVAANGDVVIRRNEGRTQLNVGAPVDARLVRVDDGLYAVYGNRTDRYRHGALGDTVEGGSVVIVDTDAENIATRVTLDPPAVFEGLSPLVADLDGDGDPELITTVSDAAAGARIRIYGTDGAELSTGPIYGSGWRHQLCVAPFGSDGESELAVVRKPHVDRTVEFYRLTDDGLGVVATEQGYASHIYGSRTLDGGLAGDLDGDGKPELLVPSTDRQRLAALGRTQDGAEELWSLSLGGSLTTNVAGVGLTENRTAVGWGTADQVRIWQG